MKDVIANTSILNQVASVGTRNYISAQDFLDQLIVMSGELMTCSETDEIQIKTKNAHITIQSKKVIAKNEKFPGTNHQK